MKDDHVERRLRRGERGDQPVRLFLMLVAALSMAATMAFISVESSLAQPVTCGNGVLDLGEDCDLSSPSGAFCPPQQVCDSSCNCVFLPTTTVPTTIPPTTSTTVVTPTTTSTTTLLNHYQCYENKRTAKTAIAVSVVDQFGPSNATLTRALRLCAPTNKQNEDPGADLDRDHLKAWDDKHTRPKVLNQSILNQFGTIVVDVTRPAFLFVPATKSLAGPPPALTPPTVDHFQCYKVKRSRGTPKFARINGVTGVDQFGSYTVDLLRPRYLCAPANKNGEDPTAPSHPEHLLCYKTRNNAPFARRTVNATDQFATGPMELIRRIELCVPSLKNFVGTTTSSTAPATTSTSSTVATTTVTTSTVTTTTELVTTTTEVVTTSTTSSTTTTTLYGSPSRAFVDPVRSLLD